MEPMREGEEWKPPPKADEWLARYVSMEDLPPEGATEEELEKARELSTLVKQAVAEATKDPLPDWYNHFFLRATLVRFLRGRDGDLQAAKDMMLGAMFWFHSTGYWDNFIRKYENEDSMEMKTLIRKYSPDGLFGVDKRGAPVAYIRLGLTDTAGIIRETNWDCYVRANVYNIEAATELHYQASLKAGVSFMGTLTVIDSTGVSYARAKDTVGFLVFMMNNILQDHFPESSSDILVVNVPWYFNWAWKVISPFLAARTIGKIQIMGTGFMSTLEKFVDKSQIPAFLDGDSTEPWPWGDGGEVPDKAGKGLPPPSQLHVKSKETLEFEAKPGKLFVWEFRVLAYDLSCEARADGAVIQEARRVSAEESWQTGQYVAKGSPVKITVHFDNSHSMFREKNIEYRSFEDDLPEDFEPDL